MAEREAGSHIGQKHEEALRASSKNSARKTNSSPRPAAVCEDAAHRGLLRGQIGLILISLDSLSALRGTPQGACGGREAELFAEFHMGK
jgi:hypothetical protein